MRSLLASILVVFTIVPSAFVSPLAAEAAAVKSSTYTKLQARKLYIFGFFASLKCKMVKSIISESDAKALFKKEMTKDENADVLLDFLNDKRVNELNNFLSKYIHDNSDDCNVPEKKLVKENINLILELDELAKQEEPLPSGKN